MRLTGGRRHLAAPAEQRPGHGGFLKVLHLNARYHPHGVGGPAMSVQSLAEAWVRQGDEAVVVCRAPVGRPSWRMENGVVVYRLPLSLPDRPVSALVGEVLRSERPDVVNTHFLKGFDAAALGPVIRHRGIRLVHTVREYALLCGKGVLFRDGRRCRGICGDCLAVLDLYRPFADAVDVVVGVSRHVLERHLTAGMFPATPMRLVIPNSYDAPSRIEPRRATTGALRLGYLGRISEEKGLEPLLKAVAGISQVLPLSLAVAGRIEPGYGASLAARFAGPATRFLGHTAPERFFPEIDLLVVPSLCEETFGRGVIEGFAHGVPALVSRLGGLPELIEPEVTGWVFDPDLPDSLAQCIGNIVADRSRLICMAEKCTKAAERYCTDAVLRSYRSAYAPN